MKANVSWGKEKQREREGYGFVVTTTPLRMPHGEGKGGGKLSPSDASHAFDSLNEFIPRSRSRLLLLERRINCLLWLWARIISLVLWHSDAWHRHSGWLGIPYGLLVLSSGIRLARVVFFLYAFNKDGILKVVEFLHRLAVKFQHTKADILSELHLAEQLLCRLDKKLNNRVRDTAKSNKSRDRWKSAILRSMSKHKRSRYSIVSLNEIEIKRQLEMLLSRTSMLSIISRFVNPVEIEHFAQIMIEAVIGSLYSACSGYFIALTFDGSSMGLFNSGFSMSHFIRRCCLYTIVLSFGLSYMPLFLG